MIIKKVSIVNEGKIIIADVSIKNGLIHKIGEMDPTANETVINGTGKYLFPGIIDGQVHFREPGPTHKGDLYTESRAAVAGGVTSFIDMPNTIPNVLTIENLHDKYKLASEKSLANYSFFMGVNADNIDRLLGMDTSGFIGLSDDGLYFTKKGNLLADRPDVMYKLFKESKSIIAVHAEDEQIIDENEKALRKQYGEHIPMRYHPIIRSDAACYAASKKMIDMAVKFGTRLHILHLSTEVETNLFRNDIPLSSKKITTEVSVQHLWFSDQDYDRLGSLIKWNPAIKSEKDRIGLLQALLDDRIDIITTDHAPHTLEEKKQSYFKAPSGGPMVQHSLNIMLELHKLGKISLEKIVEKMCHNVAILYGIEKRGFIREGYYADMVIVDLNSNWTVGVENILYKCGWSPLHGTKFHTKITHTFVNGNLLYDNGHFNEGNKGMPLTLVNKE
ncbi:dihydroorotase [Pedobacter sp. KBW06]|uniref:dihydroorotase n=1 Tax=Pedobacter sp. KBW06 TaxID=2153359 RepID=UPI000F5B3B15|nr:dihydroorotase [Pedobacter sp. KBW06]RQO74488.1 dihydroorotase [Pedobacter sp. KBW06]